VHVLHGVVCRVWLYVCDALIQNGFSFVSRSKSSNTGESGLMLKCWLIRIQRCKQHVNPSSDEEIRANQRFRSMGNAYVNRTRGNPRMSHRFWMM